MSILTDSGHTHGKIKESKCREQFVFKKLTPEGPFLDWPMTREWSGPQALQGLAAVPPSGLSCQTKGCTLSHYGFKGLNLKRLLFIRDLAHRWSYIIALQLQVAYIQIHGAEAFTNGKS